MKKQSYQYGAFAESIAANFLRLKGYKIITQRYKTKFGEIDIIAQKSQTIIFIEVKARKKHELLEVILRQNQVERIKNAASFFIAQNLEFEKFDVRFDFILFERSFVPQHFEGFFE